jgi:hypothetical protein
MNNLISYLEQIEAPRHKKGIRHLENRWSYHSDFSISK